MTWSLQSTKVIASLGLSVDVSSVMIMRTERPTATMAGAFPRFAGWGRRSGDCIGMKLSVPRARWYRLAATADRVPPAGTVYAVFARFSRAARTWWGSERGCGHQRRSGEIRNSHVVEAEESEETVQPSGPLRGEM